MEKGLDELIEWLLTEIGFSGLEGLRALDLVRAVKIFYQGSHDASGPPAIITPGSIDSPDVETADIAHASVVWQWLVARDDVIVVPAHHSRISLEDALALPEEDLAATSTTQGQPSNDTSQATDPGPVTKHISSSALTNVRPRLHLSEERQWKAIAGHGPDLKRIPRFEWRALVAIASVRDKGILQGDLVRLTGQDKRSLPTRTEALARKGYVIKQPAMLRGCRTSKLWLAQFAEKAKEEVCREGLPMDRLDLSKATLIASWAPVPFSHYYNGKSLDYLAIAQAFLAVVKAYGAMRYCDLRTKLDINERIPQMRGLAKSSRWFSKIGVIRFEPMQSRNSNKLFKDCVRYLRDPTEEEWRKFRATPKTNLKAPSSRIRKKAKSTASQSEPNGAVAKQSRRAGTMATPEPNVQPLPSPSLIRLSAWTPYKPMINTVFEIIKRGGSQGSSNAQIGMFSLGWAYRKWIASMTTLLGLPRSYPAQLQAFAVTAQLKRVGKTNTYQFIAGNVSGTAGPSASKALSEFPGRARNDHGDEGSSKQHRTGPIAMYAFPAPDPSRFLTSGSNVAGLIQVMGAGEPKKGGTKRKQSSDEAPSSEVTKPSSRTHKRARQDIPATPVRTGVDNSPGDMPLRKHNTLVQSNLTVSSVPEEDKATGSVSYGKPNSLAPFKSPGRPRKSIVMVFKHPALRNLNFFTLNKSSRRKPGENSSEMQGPVDSTTHSFTSINGNVDRNVPDTSVATPAESDTRRSQSAAVSTATPVANDDGRSLSVASSVAANGRSPVKRARKAATGGFECDTCGNTWKNANGLEYHQRKSKSACNPNYVALPPKPILITLTEQNARPTTDHSDDDATEVINRKERPKPQRSGKTLPSKRPELAISQKPFPAQGSQTQPSAMISNPVQLRNIPEVPSGNKSRASSTIDRRKSRRSENPVQKVPGMPSRRLSDDQAATVGQESHGSSSKNSTAQGAKELRRNSFEERSNALVTASELLPPDTRYSTATSSGLTPNSRGRLSYPASSAWVSGQETSDTISNVEDGSPAVSLLQGVPSSNPPSLDVSAPKRQSIATQRNTKSAATERRERVAGIITDLLDGNNGVFPGDRSLYLVLASRWIQKFDDVSLPDWKTCQTILNKLEQAKVLKQQYFAFFDKSGKTRSTSVISRVPSETNDATSIANGVTETKNKAIELYPDPYIPTGFSLPRKEAELFDVVKARYRSGADEATHDTSQWAGTEVSTLNYEMPLERGGKPKSPSVSAPSRTLRTKRTLQDTTDLGDSDTMVSGKRRRTDGCEYRDTERMAKLIWNQKKTRSEWQQSLPNLQDPETSAWSQQPQQSKSSLNVDPVFDLTGDHSVEAAPVKTRRRRLRRRQSSNATSPPAEQGNADGNISGHINVPTLDADHIHDSMDARQPTVTPAKTRPRTLRRRRMSNVTVPPAEKANINVQRSWDIDVLVPDVDKAIEASASVQFMVPTTAAAFNAEDHGVHEEEDDDDPDDDAPETSSQVDIAEDQTVREETDEKFPFTPVRQILAMSDGVWPLKFPRAFFMNRPGGSFAMVGYFPDSRWFLRQNLPQTAEEMIESSSSDHKLLKWSEPGSQYEEFVRNVTKIETWEVSPEGVYLQNRGTIAPDHIFISLSIDSSLTSMQPTRAEWPNDTQFAMGNLPDEFFDASSSSLDDDEREPSRLYTVDIPRKRRKRGPYGKSKRRLVIRRNEGNFKTRALFEVPKRPGGRWNKTRAVGESLGRNAETELIVAIVIVKKLAGGVDKFVDWGLLLKIFPAWSLAGIKRFWARVGKERGNYIDALSSKFESAFLEAYEKGDITPIDYDNLENYDWKTLISWATKIETHDGFELPSTRQQFDSDYSLTRPKNYEENWRQMWYGVQSSVLARVDAVAGLAVTLPAAGSMPTLDTDAQLARSWIRALCNNTNGDTLGAEVRSALLKLGNRDKAALDVLLESAVVELTESKVIAKVRQKLVGQVFKLNSVFERRAEKQTCFDKYTQAITFKAELDESFRGKKEVILPYNASDGAIMVMINLQAYGRIRLEDVKFPHVPFGFEPSNYEGRKFSKSYYQWDVRLVPTDNYIYNEDLAVVAEAKDLPVPKCGPRGEIPIWYDFFGNLDRSRWTQWLCMVTIALATKGLVNANGAVELLSPSVEEFEAQLIIDWLDRLGLLERATENHGRTVGEWWWLAVGQLVDAKGKGIAGR